MLGEGFIAVRHRAPGSGRKRCGTAACLATALLASVLAVATGPALAADPPPAAEDVPVVRFTVTGFKVEGPNPLTPEATDAILAPLAGEYAGVDGLLAAADALGAAFAEAGHTFHRVVLPPQRLDGGVVTLQVNVVTLGEVRVTGNVRTPEYVVRGTVPTLVPGTTPDLAELGRSLDFANLQPSRTTFMNLREGKAPDTVDAELRIEERRPWQAFAALNDIGTEDTGRLRMTLGGQYSELFGRDHRVAGTWTMSPDNANDVLQGGAQYQIPLYASTSLLSFFAVYSDVDIGTVGGVGDIGTILDVAGSGEFFGASYAHRLRNRGALSHGWSVGIQDKLFRNEFAGLTFKVRSRPVNVGYDATWRTPRTRTSFYVNFAKNLPNGPHNDDKSYVASPRAGAEQSWESLRLGGTFTYLLPQDWNTRLLLDAQLSDQPLIAGEQFGVGGAYSVRGFEERQIAGDEGWRTSLELWTPPLQVLPGLRALAFYDAGQMYTREAGAGQPDKDTIASVGGGLRYEWQDSLTFTVDYGYSVADVKLPGGRERGNVKWHFMLVYRY